MEVSSEPGEPDSPGEAGEVSERGTVLPLTTIEDPEVGSDRVLPPTVIAGPPGLKVEEPKTI